MIGLRRKESNSGPATLSVFPCSAPGYRFSFLPPTAVWALRNLIASCSTKAVIHEQYSQAIGAPPSVLGLAEVNLCPLHIFPTCSFGKHEDCTVLRRKKAENNYSDNTAEERKNMEVLGGISLLNGGYRLLAYIFRARALQFSTYTHLGRLLWGALFTIQTCLQAVHRPTDPVLANDPPPEKNRKTGTTYHRGRCAGCSRCSFLGRVDRACA